MTGNVDDSSVKSGVILAAGFGKRMLPLSANYPKVLLPVCNKPMIQYQIEAMHKSGIFDITIVIGHLGDKIRKYFGNGSSFGVRLKYVVDRKPEGIASSLLKVKNKVGGPFVLFLGDIFMKKINLKGALLKFQKEAANGVVVAVQEKTFEPVKSNFEIITGPDQLIIEMVEKPKNPRSLIKGIGVYVFSPAIFDAILHTGRTTLRGEFEITDSIQTLIFEYGKVYCDIWNTWDVNVNYPEDLAKIDFSLYESQSGRRISHKIKNQSKP